MRAEGTAGRPGRIAQVDVGGRRLAGEDAGAGGRAVVLEAGGGCTGESWDAVLAAVAGFTRVVRYDRAGLGASEPAAMPRACGAMVADLRALLAGLAVPPPYVVVGHSFGGLLARLYAHLHPAEVAGLVLVDAPHPEQNRRAAALLPAPTPGDSERLVSMRRMLGGAYEADPRYNPEGLHVPTMDAELLAVGHHGDRPLVVLTAMRHDPVPDLPADFLAAYDRMFHELQRDLAGQSTRSAHVLAERSGHFIQSDQPELVVAAVRRVVEAVRGAEW